MDLSAASMDMYSIVCCFLDNCSNAEGQKRNKITLSLSHVACQNGPKKEP